MTSQERDSLILSYLDQVRPLLLHYAVSAKLDVDDLHQDATITIMHALDLKPGEEYQLHGYITTSVRNRIIDRIRYNQRHQADSLDAPQDENGLPLADLLPCPYSFDPLALVLAQERLAELQPPEPGEMNPRKRRAVRELHATALASMEV